MCNFCIYIYENEINNNKKKNLLRLFTALFLISLFVSFVFESQTKGTSRLLSLKSTAWFFFPLVCRMTFFFKTFFFFCLKLIPQKDLSFFMSLFYWNTKNHVFTSKKMKEEKKYIVNWYTRKQVFFFHFLHSIQCFAFVVSFFFSRVSDATKRDEKQKQTKRKKKHKTKLN